MSAVLKAWLDPIYSVEQNGWMVPVVKWFYKM